jgi:hypothetical protein
MKRSEAKKVNDDASESENATVSAASSSVAYADDLNDSDMPVFAIDFKANSNTNIKMPQAVNE